MFIPCNSYNIIKEDSLTITKKKKQNENLKIDLDNFSYTNYLDNNIHIPTLSVNSLLKSANLCNRTYNIKDDELQIIDYPYQNDQEESDNFLDFVPPIIPSKDESWFTEKNIENYNFKKTISVWKKDEDILKLKTIDKLNKDDNNFNMNYKFLPKYEKKDTVKDTINGKITTKNHLTEINNNYIIINNTHVNNADIIINTNINTNVNTNTNSNPNSNLNNKSQNKICRNITQYINKNKKYYDSIKLCLLKQKDNISGHEYYKNARPHRNEKNTKKLAYKTLNETKNITNDQLQTLKKNYINNNFREIRNRNKPKKKTNIDNNRELLNINRSNIPKDCNKTMTEQKSSFIPGHLKIINNNMKGKNEKDGRFSIQEIFSSKLNNITNTNTYFKVRRKNCLSAYNKNHLFMSSEINKYNRIRNNLKTSLSLTNKKANIKKNKTLKTIGKIMGTPTKKMYIHFNKKNEN